MEDIIGDDDLFNDKEMIIKSISEVYIMEFNSIYRILLEEMCCETGINIIMIYIIKDIVYQQNYLR